MSATVAERMEQEAQEDRAQAMTRVIVVTAREYGMPVREALPTNDTEWFRVWRMAKLTSPPSEQTKALCREFVEQQVQLQELEEEERVAGFDASDDAFDRHVDGKIAEERGM